MRTFWLGALALFLIIVLGAKLVLRAISDKPLVLKGRVIEKCFTAGDVDEVPTLVIEEAETHAKIYLEFNRASVDFPASKELYSTEWLEKLDTLVYVDDWVTVETFDLAGETREVSNLVSIIKHS
jgi:hypothetical protein